jgi:spermidine synthase
MTCLGTEIHRVRDDQGWILVFESGARRTLSFNGGDEQSGMSLLQPDRLEYVYTQAMLLGTLLASRTWEALVLGLGGGSLVRALLRYFPACRVTAVESRPQVVEVARRFFALPEDPRLQLRIGEAETLLAELPGPFDLILADLYGPAGMDSQQTGASFLDGCRTSLAPAGVLAMNLWNTDYRVSRSSRAALIRAFAGGVLQLVLPGGNQIAFGFPGELPRPEPRALFERAQTLGLRMEIPLQRLARALWSQNLPALHQGRRLTDLGDWA